MAKQRKSAEAAADPMDRIARLLALLVIKEVDKDDAALQLDGACFSAKEISEMLGVSENYLHSLKNRLKKGKKRRKATKA